MIEGLMPLVYVVSGVVLTLLVQKIERRGEG